MFGKVWFVDMRTGVVIEVSTVVMMAVGVDMLAGAEIGEVTAAMSGLEVVAGVTYAVEALADTIFGGASAIGAEANATSLNGSMPDLEFAVTIPLEDSFLSWEASRSSWPMTALDCDRDLQACKPSYHVWSTLVSPALPQFPNQEPPRPQQLILPDRFVIPHMGHTELIVIAAAAICDH